MAKRSLSKSRSNLNLSSRRHILIYQKILFVGNQMAGKLNWLDKQTPLPQTIIGLVDDWGNLMKQLEQVLL